MQAGRVRVFVATSVDGFIAGPDDDLSWLPGPEPGGGDHGFGAFLAQVGALLMGRRTYDVVTGFEGPWPYGERPVLVATHRPLAAVRPHVRPIAGSVATMVSAAREAAAGRDVYVDGGALIRQVLDAGLVDELTLHVVPVILGAGHPLFMGTTARHRLRLVQSDVLGGAIVRSVYARQ